MKKTVFLLTIISFFSCSKNEPPSSSGSSNSSGSSSTSPTKCSTITAQSSVTSNGVTYTINALAGAGNSIGIEVVNSNGAFTNSYDMKLLEVVSGTGTACDTETTSTESLPGIGKFFEFKNMPSWASNNSTVAKVNIMLDGTVYSIQDLHVNQ